MNKAVVDFNYFCWSTLEKLQIYHCKYIQSWFAENDNMQIMALKFNLCLAMTWVNMFN